MSKQAKIRLVKDITNRIRDEVVKLIRDERIPDHWDGIELRQLLADRFASLTLKGMTSPLRKRRFNRTKKALYLEGDT